MKKLDPYFINGIFFTMLKSVVGRITPVFLLLFFTVAHDGLSAIKACNPYIQQLSGGGVKFSVTFGAPQAYVEVFATKNGAQNIAVNIVGSQVNNGDGTYTYSYVPPTSIASYVTGDVILTRFYSYVSGGAGVFTPGPSEGVWSDPFTYNVTIPCVVTPPTPTNCNDYIQQLSNGDIKFLITFGAPQAYVEVFSTQNGLQNVAINIVNSQVNNGDGTYSYSYVVSGAKYATGDKIYARFYSYIPAGSGVFTPGPTSGTWSSVFIYNQTLCTSCADIYEPNESLAAASTILANTIISAKISSTTDVDWFKITTTASAPNLQITLKNLVVDLDVYLYNSVGTQLAYSVNAGANDELINYPNSTIATYYIRVVGWIGANSMQCYALKAQTGASPFRIDNSSNATITDKMAGSQGVFKFYPNPVKAGNSLTIEMNSLDNSSSGVVKILDMNGEIVSEQTVSIKDGSTTINLSGIYPGIYILDGGNQNKQKLVIE